MSVIFSGRTKKRQNEHVLTTAAKKDAGASPTLADALWVHLISELPIPRPFAVGFSTTSLDYSPQRLKTLRHATITCLIPLFVVVVLSANKPAHDFESICYLWINEFSVIMNARKPFWFLWWGLKESWSQLSRNSEQLIDFSWLTVQRINFGINESLWLNNRKC